MISLRLMFLFVILSGFTVTHAQEPRIEVPSTFMDAASRIRNFVPSFLKGRPAFGGMFRKVLGFGKQKNQVDSSIEMMPSEMQGYPSSPNQGYYYPQVPNYYTSPTGQSTYQQIEANGGRWPNGYQNVMYQPSYEAQSPQSMYGSEAQQAQYGEGGQPNEMSQSSLPQPQYATDSQSQEQSYPGYYQAQQYGQQPNSMQGYEQQNSEQQNQFSQNPMQTQGSNQYPVAYQGHQQDPQYQESAPYPVMASSNPSQANTFHSRPYGPNPGTIDVHQVLDQFIRSAGLSPQGDHENVKGPSSYAAAGTKPVITLKKLYSYPFFFSNKGEPTGHGYHRRESASELNNAQKLVTQQLANNLEIMKSYLSTGPIPKKSKKALINLWNKNSA